MQSVKGTPVGELQKELGTLAIDVENVLRENMSPTLFKLHSEAEKCPIDGTKITICNYGSAECENNHEFERCIASHRCICKNLDDDVLQCPLCLCLVLSSSKINSPE